MAVGVSLEFGVHVQLLVEEMVYMFVSVNVINQLQNMVERIVLGNKYKQSHVVQSFPVQVQMRWSTVNIIHSIILWKSGVWSHSTHFHSQSDLILHTVLNNIQDCCLKIDYWVRRLTDSDDLCRLKDVLLWLSEVFEMKSSDKLSKLSDEIDNYLYHQRNETFTNQVKTSDDWIKTSHDFWKPSEYIWRLS